MNHEALPKMVGVKTKVIWEGYQELLAEFRDLEAQMVASTTAIAEKERVAGAIKSADEVDVEDIDASVQGIVSSIATAMERYNDLKTAIAAKKAELEEVHGIEVEANTLVAVVATKDKMVTEKTEQARIVVEDAKVRAEELLATARESAANIRASAREEDQAGDQARDRKQAEWDYDFDRRVLEKNDKVQDAINDKLRELEAKQQAVAEREAKADELDANLLDLEQQLQHQKDQTANEIELAVEKAKKGAATSAAIAKSMDSKSHAADMSIIEARAKGLEERVVDLEGRLETANALVAAANTQVTEMAQASLRAGADANTIAELHKAQASGGKK